MARVSRRTAATVFVIGMTACSTPAPAPALLNFDREPTANEERIIRSSLRIQLEEAEATEAQRTQPGPIRIRAGAADINKDGTDEIFVQIWSSQWCAPVGCNTWILQQGDNVSRQLFGDEYTGEQADVMYMSPKETGRFRNLIAVDQTALGANCALYRWNGTRYAFDVNAPDKNQCPPEILRRS